MIYDVISNPEPPEPELVTKVQRAHMILTLRSICFMNRLDRAGC